MWRRDKDDLRLGKLVYVQRRLELKMFGQEELKGFIEMQDNFISSFLVIIKEKIDNCFYL